MSHKSRIIKVDYLARVEGEGALRVETDGDRVEDIQLKIFEPPRFFESFLRGRSFTEAPDITARICGICPVAYQMSACHAMESVSGTVVGDKLRALRRALYCGEWIESHGLHVFMLHAPDFLGYASGMEMAKDYKEIVTNGLKLKKLGNDIGVLLGGREIHPINVKVGGFYKIPSRSDCETVIKNLEWGADVAEQTARWVAGFDFPDLEPDYQYVALKGPGEYPMNEGRIVSNRGLDIDASEYEQRFEEIHVERSNALHSRLIADGSSYFVGPMARFHLNFEQLTPRCRKVAEETGALPPMNNPFKSIIVRSIEMLYACEEAKRLLSELQGPIEPSVELSVKSARAMAATEAPRGILYHRYDVDASGIIREAKICPPTSQNQRQIERDLWSVVEGNLHFADEELQWLCEQAIRNYDPCISCATHFLKFSRTNVSQ